VNALRKIHRALVPGGLLVDAQPVGGRVPVDSTGTVLGTLDMREWRRTVNSVAELIDETVAGGLFSAETERGYDVLETFDDGKELVETVSEWAGTKISRALAARVEGATPPLAIRESAAMPFEIKRVRAELADQRIGLAGERVEAREGRLRRADGLHAPSRRAGDPRP